AIALLLCSAKAAQAQTAVELTPAQQCVSDGYPIPTVGKPTAEDAAKAQRWHTVGGWAFLDGNSPVVGGKVELRTRQGERLRLARRGSRRTNRRGAFLVAAASLPRSVTVVVKGG